MAGSKHHFAAGEQIFLEGDPPTAAFVIDSGRVEVYTEDGDQHLVLNYLGPGDLLGEMAVIDREPRSASARAVGECVLTEIRDDQIQERIEQTDPVVRLLVQALLQRYRTGLRAVRDRGIPMPEPMTDARDSATIMDKFRLEAELMDAIENDELTVVFQPIFDCSNNAIVGFESLTRWTHPKRGNISPGEFIALAEETSLILPVGQYALTKSCQTLAALHGQLPAALSEQLWVSVNVSARQSVVPDFVELIAKEISRFGLDAGHFKVEITESLTLDFERVAEMMVRCKARGIGVSLDDFGTGHANLSRLHALDFDTVKLDQSFVNQMIDNSRCAELVQGIISMIRALGADVVAEGVETLQQAEMLRSFGCRYLQGYLIGKPSPAASLPEMISTTRLFAEQ